jgi:enoyl-[acyl-carrier protein] reductase II
MNPITEMLGVKYPIIQGALGGISNPELVAAVSEAGGFGLLATGFIREPARLLDQIRAVKALTRKPFGANLVVLNPMSRSFAEILIEQGIKAVTVSAGSPEELVSMLKPPGVRVLQVIPTVEAAVRAEALGVDAVIAEGTESGGIQGYRGASTMVLVPLVADAVKIPVVAAGGIGDSRGFRAALALGAKGVQVGTRFIATRECIAHQNYKDALCRAAETETVLIPRGRVRIRALRTPLAERLLERPPEAASTPAPEALEEAWIRGNLDANPLAAGEIAGMVRDVKSVREIIQEMVS